MSDESLDIHALRRGALDDFAKKAREYFAKHSECQSLVLAVSQYYADEAGDAVHEAVYAFPTREPSWPHFCEYDAPPPDGSKCSSCDYDGVFGGSLDSNTEAVHAWSAFCTEYGGGEGSASLADPIAIAVRTEDGDVDLELVHELVRPWMDTNSVATLRDTEDYSDDEEPAAPKPEPKRAPWTAAEKPLLEAVLAAPADDAPRRVLVDHWLERGDVRGDFGAISFGEPANTAARRRRDALAWEHGRTWLGPLQPFITPGAARFGRGPFVHSAVVSWNDEDAKPDELAEWALLEELRFAGERHPVSRHMRGLRRAFGITEETLAVLTRLGFDAPLDTAGLTGFVPEPGEWAAVKAFAKVRRLVLEQASAATNLPSLPCWSQLETVEVWVRAKAGSSADADRPWTDRVAAEVVRVLRPKLSASQRLVVGYHFGNDARGGVVAVVTSSGITFENRRFAGAEARAAAEKQLAPLSR